MFPNLHVAAANLEGVLERKGSTALNAALEQARKEGQKRGRLMTSQINFTPSQSQVITEHLQRGLILASLRPDPLGEGVIPRFVGEEVAFSRPCMRSCPLVPGQAGHGDRRRRNGDHAAGRGAGEPPTGSTPSASTTCG